MIKNFISLSLIWVSLWLPAQGQILEPVKWAFEAQYVEGDQYDLIFKATIDEGWSIYSQYLESDDGPIRTSFVYEAPSGLETLGKNNEVSPKRKEGHDELFDMNVIKFSQSVTFTQRVKVTDAGQPVSGYLEFMACDATKCLPPTEVDFSIELPAAKASQPVEVSQPAPKPEAKPEPAPKPEPTSPKTNETRPTPPEPKASDGSTSEGTASKDKERKKKENAEEAKEKTSQNVAADTKPDTATDNGSNGGILEPVKWTYSSKKIKDGLYELTFHAQIDKGWYTYSQFITDDGPVPTSVQLDEGSPGKIVGQNKEQSDHRIEGHDEIFDMQVVKFKEAVDFVQQVEIADASQPVTGYLEFMACDATKCLPPSEVLFSITLADEALKAAIPNPDADSMGDAGTPSSPNGSAPNALLKTAGENTINAETFETSRVDGDCSGNTPKIEKRSYWQTFIKGLIGGLIALFTPCVFPMIPLTVSFFLKGNKDKRKGFRDAILYGLSIVVIYTGLGTIVTSIFGAGALNALASDPWFNLGLAVLLVVFAFSFFGFFEIQLPAKWADKTDRVADKGGFIGILAMAATLAIVSFSCTGPLIGVLLVDTVSNAAGSTSGIPIEPIIGMFGFSLALALPFALFAAFPSWLSSLPKSGGWMDDVKVSVGFLEIALALKFLAVFSLIMENKLGLKVLPYEAFVALWVIIALLWAAYILGWFKFKKDPYADGGKKKLPLGKIVLGVALLGLAAWNMMGFQTHKGTNIYQATSLMSGLAPPACHSYTKPCDCPHAINCHKDYFAAKEIAKTEGKPLFIDFTGYSCENCRRNEESVWPLEGVIEKLRDDYVVVSLYVDERKELPEIYKSAQNGRVRTVGQRWADFQIIHMGSNTQPLYVLGSVNPDNTVTILNEPLGGLIQNSDKFKTFLQCGLDVHAELQAARQ